MAGSLTRDSLSKGHRVQRACLRPPPACPALAHTHLHPPAKWEKTMSRSQKVQLWPDPLAEQAIRFVVIDRHITQGTRSEAGRRFSERIWTVIATCLQQGKAVYDYLREAVQRWFEGEAAPSLLGGKT